MENNTQKITKISVSSSESYSDLDSSGAEPDESEYERTPQASSIKKPDLSELISLIVSTLSEKELSIDTSDSSLNTLTTLVSILCTEFLKITHKKPEESDVYEKILNTKQESVEFSYEDCHFLLELLKGLTRDVNSNKFNSKVHELEVEIVKNAKNIAQLRSELKMKNLEVKEWRRSHGNKRKVNKMHESASTLDGCFGE
jgi:hypothetical protein